MSPLPIVFLLAGLSALIVWASIYSERRKKARLLDLEERLASLAQEWGGEYRPQGLRKRDDWSDDARRPDVRFLKRFPFLDDWMILDATRVENLITARQGDLDLYAFEIATPATKARDWHRVVVAIRLTSRLPNLLIWPIDSPLAGAAHSITMPVIRTEWEEFNRRYMVQSANAREAHGFLTPEIMELLVGAEPCHWAVGGCYLYASPYGSTDFKGKPSPADHVEAIRKRMEVARELVSRIPAYLLKEGETGHRWPSPLA